MILKDNLLLITLLYGCILTIVTAYPDYEDESSNAHAENTHTNSNDDIYDPALLQQQVEASEKRYEEILNQMDMDTKTEVSLKNVRNISDNQLSNEYISIEHEDEEDGTVVSMSEEDDVGNENNTSAQSTEQNTKMLTKDEDYETENPLSKKIRMGRFFTTTTTVPQYIRKMVDGNPVKDINVSNSDYVEEEEGSLDHMLRKPTTKIPYSRNLDNSSEENDDIVPLAMKYYDEIPPENASSSRHIEEVSSEDYYEEEYHEPESTTTTTSTSTLPTSDSNILRSLLGGFTTATETLTSTSTIPTPTPTPLTTTISDNNPLYDPVFITTSTPLVLPPQPQTQTAFDLTTTSRNAAPATSAIPNDKKGKQIPIVTNTVPVITTTTTTTTRASSRRRLLPHEQLRNYIEDAYIRMPLAVIVDPSAEALEKTKALWNDAMSTDLNIKIIMVTLNYSGK